MTKKTSASAPSAIILSDSTDVRSPDLLGTAGEFGAIARFAARLQTRAGVRVGIGDDCAVLDALRTPVVSTDALVEGVHFRRDWTSARDLGRKTLAVSVSDLASGGAYPVAAFLSLCAPPDVEMAWLGEFYDGMESLANEFAFTVAGGDTTRAGQLMMSATLVGELLPEADGQPVLRSGAKVGDWVCVTGDLGASAAGLALLQRGQRAQSPAHAEVLRRHFDPSPRLDTMRVLLQANRAAIHAGMDISDGLVGDANHIAARSGVRLVLDAAQIPLSSATLRVADELGVPALPWALGGGEDYELLLCLAPDAFDSLHHLGAGLTRVGDVVAGAGVKVLQGAEAESWTHF